jgi:hypothetical protein
VRLLYTQNFPGLGLGETAFFDEAINLQGKAGFELLARGIGKAEVSKDVAAAFFDPDFGAPFHFFHFSCAFLCNPVQRPQAAVLSGLFPFGGSICPSLTSSGKHEARRLHPRIARCKQPGMRRPLRALRFRARTGRRTLAEPLRSDIPRPIERHRGPAQCRAARARGKP